LPFVNTILVITFILGTLGWLAAATLGTLKLVRGIEERDENKQDQATSSLPISRG
jgi:hypothetical protein